MLSDSREQISEAASFRLGLEGPVTALRCQPGPNGEPLWTSEQPDEPAHGVGAELVTFAVEHRSQNNDTKKHKFLKSNFLRHERFNRKEAERNCQRPKLQNIFTAATTGDSSIYEYDNNKQ